ATLVLVIACCQRSVRFTRSGNGVPNRGTSRPPVLVAGYLTHSYPHAVLENSSRVLRAPTGIHWTPVTGAWSLSTTTTACRKGTDGLTSASMTTLPSGNPLVSRFQM